MLFKVYWVWFTRATEAKADVEMNDGRAKGLVSKCEPTLMVVLNQWLALTDGCQYDGSKIESLTSISKDMFSCQISSWLEKNFVIGSLFRSVRLHFHQSCSQFDIHVSDGSRRGDGRKVPFRSPFLSLISPSFRFCFRREREPGFSPRYM